MTDGPNGFEDAAAEGELEDGGILGVEVGGEPVVLAKLDGSVYALGGVCTHAGGDLADGWLEGETLKCPLHNSGFNIRTGQAIGLPAKTPVPVYDVRVEGGRIWVSKQPR